MSIYKRTNTERNLLTAFVRESQARNKYTFLRRKQNKKDMSKLRHCFYRQPIMKRSMPSYGSTN